MKENTWQCTYQDIEIVVKNAWNWSGDTKEEIWLGGELVHQEEYNANRTAQTTKFGYFKEYTVNDIKISIKTGSAWHCFGVACQILINDKYHAGDKVVLFASKKSKVKDGGW